MQPQQFQWKVVVFVLFYATTFYSQNDTKKSLPNIVWIVSEDNSKHYMKLFDENGVATPNIEKLVEHGLLFTHAFSNAAVCSVARSTIISGSYAPRTGTQYHRRNKLVPMPTDLKMFPAYLRDAGYYTTNNSKEDYNFIKDSGVWDDSSKTATWRNRKNGQPFFHVFNIETTHESSLHYTKEEMESLATITSQNKNTIQPNHPKTKIFEFANAYYRDKHVEMDKQVGKVVSQLKEDGLLESTFIFYYGDHGGVLPGSKGYVYETGLHVPMVVYVPEKYRDFTPFQIGGTVDGFVSFIDLAPTVLNLAGVTIPKQLDGKPFLGKVITKKEIESRNTTYGYADRFDEKYDMVRSVRVGKYKYIRSYQPFNFDGLTNNYRYKQVAYQEWEALYEAGELIAIQKQFFKPRKAEMLFDVEADPFETKDLSSEASYKKILSELRNKLIVWEKGMPDLSFYPEFYLIKNAFDNPVAFGQAHKKQIKDYRTTANWMLLDYKKAAPKIKEGLQSKDPWKRYWSIIVCSSFADKAKSFIPEIKMIEKNDTELINKVRAAEFLGLIKVKNPSKVMLDALYATKDATEGLLILNSITLLNSFDYGFDFEIEPTKIQAIVQQDKLVQERLNYLKKKR
ncbi:sulfatase [Aureibaculum algae]|uniref:Sulfatase n=1 Tax=Aureibaculum algae TaxID=2584122 RepID=A0A5B7TY97_9FLAO|nr:sulfatase [Aureibaculum algae]QCX40324.1 sulfatase [Aureibaculum algae]